MIAPTLSGIYACHRLKVIYINKSTTVKNYNFYLTVVWNYNCNFVCLKKNIIMFRSVSPQDKSVSIALTEVLLSAFTWIPGPIVYGALLGLNFFLIIHYS